MKLYVQGLILVAILSFALALNPFPIYAKETIKYSCSNQIYKAFDKEKIDAFIAKTGINVEVALSSSESALYRLMRDFSDIASTARKLDKSSRYSDYVQIPLCRDPIAIIAHSGCNVDNITKVQLQDIFNGHISNWKELGGVDLPMVLVVPGVDTAAYKNFTHDVMGKKKIRYDFMAYDSVMAADAVTHYPCGTISFITQGAVHNKPEIQAIQVDGILPSDDKYPYFQEFFYVTKGQPKGAVKAFIDFSFSDESLNIMRKKGVIPTSP
jgi:phosphate transport system substrate-binding protein